MKFGKLGLLVAVAVLAGLAASVPAKADTPPGSYRQTCKNIKTSGSTLRARCKDGEGNYRDSELSNYYQCQNDIQNNNGYLQCGGGSGQYGYNQQWNGNVPAGSYQQTCRNVEVRGRSIWAECQDGNGNWRGSELPNADRCTGEIQNINGNLQCTGGYGNGSYGDRRYGQGGSYQQTCTDIERRGDRLRARCQDASGNWHDTELRDADRCNGEIQNINGNLQCTGSGGNYRGNGPSGSYQQTCRNIEMRGNNIRAECQDGNGNWQRTTLHNYRKCSGEVTNVNGQLRCSGR